jgi:hypothetical protein
MKLQRACVAGLLLLALLAPALEAFPRTTIDDALARRRGGGGGGGTRATEPRLKQQQPQQQEKPPQPQREQQQQGAGRGARGRGRQVRYTRTHVMSCRVLLAGNNNTKSNCTDTCIIFV